MTKPRSPLQLFRSHELCLTHSASRTLPHPHPQGSPSFPYPALVEADLEDGSLARMGKTGGPDDWKLAVVQAYAVPPHPLGEEEAAGE